MKLRVIVLTVICSLASFYLSLMNAGCVPLCVLAGMILYELKKMNSKDK